MNTNNSQVTEVERAACTLLADHVREVVDPAVAEWISRLLSDPGLVEWCPTGHHPNSSDWEMEFDWQAAEPLHWLRFERRGVCEAVCNLGGALASYRADDRPTGDVTTALDTSGITVTTSLAAAISEYHQAILSVKLNARALMHEEA